LLHYASVYSEYGPCHRISGYHQASQSQALIAPVPHIGMSQG